MQHALNAIDLGGVGSALGGAANAVGGFAGDAVHAGKSES